MHFELASAAQDTRRSIFANIANYSYKLCFLETDVETRFRQTRCRTILAVHVFKITFLRMYFETGLYNRRVTRLNHNDHRRPTAQRKLLDSDYLRRVTNGAAENPVIFLYAL